MYICKSLFGISKGAVTIKAVSSPGDRVIDGPFACSEDARRSRAYVDNQRKFVLADGEEVRIHASNGGYLFSVRAQVGGPVIVHDQGFSGLPDEYEALVDIYPWNKKGKL